MWFPLIILTYLVQWVSPKAIIDFKNLTSEEDTELDNCSKDSSVWDFGVNHENHTLSYLELRNGLVSDRLRWPNNEVPYMFGPNLTHMEKDNINSVLQEFISYSCIVPKLITKPVRDYVLIQGKNRGCYARVGRIGGRQILNLSTGTTCHRRRVIRHEFLHALGFWHQQGALERDNYVNIHYENIRPGRRFNFHKWRTTNFETKYDFESIMHYGRFTFSSNGQITIETKNETHGKIIGKLTELSKSDLFKLNKMYNCL